eukprot:1220707-Rhodomonas_salina.1
MNCLHAMQTHAKLVTAALTQRMTCTASAAGISPSMLSDMQRIPALESMPRATDDESMHDIRGHVATRRKGVVSDIVSQNAVPTTAAASVTDEMNVMKSKGPRACCLSGALSVVQSMPAKMETVCQRWTML